MVLWKIPGWRPQIENYALKGILGWGGGRRVWTDPRRWGLAVTAGYVSISSLNAALSIEVDQSQIMFWGASPAAQLFSYPPPRNWNAIPLSVGAETGRKGFFDFERETRFLRVWGWGITSLLDLAGKQLASWVWAFWPVLGDRLGQCDCWSDHEGFLREHVKLSIYSDYSAHEGTCTQAHTSTCSS